MASGNGNPLAPGRLEEIFREHAQGLVGAARGVLGPTCDEQEVLQEAFLRAWRALERGDTPAHPVAWVFVLTLNLARDQRRRLGRRGPHQSLEDIERVDDVKLADRRTEPLRTLSSRETLEAARAAIFGLEESEKEVFLLRVSGGLSFEAVAAALAIPVGTAKTRMRKALRRLRRHLAGFALEAGIDVPAMGTGGIEASGEAR